MDSSSGSHVSAITGMIGEDLVLGLFQHYWDSTCSGNTSEILSYDCKEERPGKRKLDAWVMCKTASGDRILYQTEIKNWSSYSRGMRTYAEPDSDAEATARWQHFIEIGNRDESLTKVAFAPRTSDIKEKMDISGQRIGEIPPRPLLCMWSPIATRTSDKKCFFTEASTNLYLPGVAVFSASLYLRLLKDQKIKIKAPRAEHRIRQREKVMWLCN